MATIDTVMMKLGEVKADVLGIVKGATGSPQVVHSCNQVIVKLDEAYMWFAVALRAALEQVSPENVDAAVEKAAADGKLRVVPLPEKEKEG